MTNHTQAALDAITRSGKANDYRDAALRLTEAQVHASLALAVAIEAHSFPAASITPTDPGELVHAVARLTRHLCHAEAPHEYRIDRGDGTTFIPLCERPVAHSMDYATETHESIAGNCRWNS